MKIKSHDWRLDILCHNCGARLEIDIDDVKVAITVKGRSARLNDVRYYIECGVCEHESELEDSCVPVRYHYRQHQIPKACIDAIWNDSVWGRPDITKDFVFGLDEDDGIVIDKQWCMEKIGVKHE